MTLRDGHAPDLFQSIRSSEPLGQQARILRNFALPYAEELVRELSVVAAISPFRRMVTPGGYRMSVMLTNCGALGWTTDERGYRYTAIDPLTQSPWPAMPAAFLDLARRAAEAAAFEGFQPDACLINQYSAGSRLSLHQDRNERDFSAPIVSVSLGLPAVFLFGGNSRKIRPLRVTLEHGDVGVWGGVDRMRYHGVSPLKDGWHAHLGDRRINLTFRKAA
jgi:DNA oxidative demethylase